MQALTMQWLTMQALLKEDLGFLQPAARRNEVVAWVTSGVRDFSISRSASAMSWGIPLPMDPSHNTYVWCVTMSQIYSLTAFVDVVRCT